MMKDNWRTQVLVYAVLTGYAFISLFPVVFIFMNSFKDRRDLFRTPYQPPVWFSLDHGLTLINKTSLAGYETVLSQGEILRYFSNSFLVSVLSLLLIVVLGLMLAYALTEYDFRGNLTLYVFFVLGIMIPQQIGTATIIDLVQALGLYDTVWALILIYTARGLPISVFVLSEFMRTVPTELKEAARVDGANEYWILARIVVPLTRPAIATVLAFQLIPVWNDLWFPLTVAPGEAARTVTLGMTIFAGQYRNDWSSLLAGLSLAMMPVTLLFVIFSRQFVAGLTRGAIK
jgi:raffinose/stachyose/melibiose transport system permease protein